MFFSFLSPVVQLTNTMQYESLCMCGPFCLFLCLLTDTTFDLESVLDRGFDYLFQWNDSFRNDKWMQNSIG
jgi:hypothetical protein